MAGLVSTRWEGVRVQSTGCSPDRSWSGRRLSGDLLLRLSFGGGSRLGAFGCVDGGLQGSQQVEPGTRRLDHLVDDRSDLALDEAGQILDLGLTDGVLQDRRVEVPGHDRAQL